MKIGVISDIHSNFRAFLACAEYMEAQGCDEYIFLGDYISDNPEPGRTLELLYEFWATHSCFIIRGNREDYILDQWKIRKGEKEGPLWIKNSASGNLLYTYDNLSEKDLLFFDSLPITAVFHKEGYPSITCAHGSPGNSRELLEFEEEPVRNWLNRIDTEYLLCAHTHRPGMKIIGKKTYINSGCSGLAISDAGLAQCVILTSETIDGNVSWIPEFLKLPYDNEAVIEDMFSSGLYDYGHWFINANIHILKTGIDKAPELISLSTKLAKEDLGEEIIWPYIDEKYFEQAAGLLGIPEYGRFKKK